MHHNEAIRHDKIIKKIKIKIKTEKAEDNDKNKQMTFIFNIPVRDVGSAMGQPKGESMESLHEKKKGSQQ